MGENNILRFAFFYELSKTGYAILKKDKGYILKYIVYPTLSKYRPYKLGNYYVHLPGTASNIMQLSFSFDVLFENKIEDIASTKSSIETSLESALYSKKLIK